MINPQLKCIFKIFLVAGLVAEMSFHPSGISLSETNTIPVQKDKILRKNRRHKVTGGGLGPRICEGKPLKAMISEYETISVSSGNASIRFFIPCKPEDIESMKFLLNPQGAGRQLPQISSEISSRGNFPGYYTHNFRLPERGREYRWYLKIWAKNSSGEIESDQVNGYITW
jgi:hypothetical protein